MSRRSRKNVGLIGLGIIGRRVAENLRKKGFHVFVWNRTPRPVPNFVGSVAEVAELCHVIQIFVSDDEALLNVVEQLSPNLSSHHIVVASCTVAPETMRIAADFVQRRDARFLEAPFTGSKNAAEKGELIYYVAGGEAVLRDARRFLEASSKEIVEFGEVGEASLVKLATNMVTAATVQSAAEALALVERCGVPSAKFERALRSNSSHSGTLGMKVPMMISGDFEPHFSVKHMFKDLDIASRLAQSSGLHLAVMNAAHHAQLEEMQNGGADQDYSSVARRFFPDGMSKTESETQPQAQLDFLSEASAQTSAEGAEPAISPVEFAPVAATEFVEPSGEETVSINSEAAETPAEIPPAVEPPSEATGAAVPAEDAPRRKLFARLFQRDADE